MEKKELLYEGKAKKIWTTQDDSLLISEFKDDLTAGNGAMKSSEEGKGALNNKISTELFNLLNSKVALDLPLEVKKMNKLQNYSHKIGINYWHIEFGTKHRYKMYQSNFLFEAIHDNSKLYAHKIYGKNK